MTRSENMARIRGKDTRPELTVRKAFWAAGLRYRLHEKSLPGKPDIVFTTRRIAVFIHGCFWHCHEGCNNFRIPKTRSEWWSEKLARNKQRDKDICSVLQDAGWRVIVIWECQAHKNDFLQKIIEELKQEAYKPIP
ncbi:DNA mismatch endonuclease Vsr [Duganella sp. FT92W]|uniref:Very short patch repair endonuclease n=1 Tax=Pseudoduganella rivuli TaxID=2666085 RepID=A0A7X2LV33_9BURK|nr:very short patch repair endonuclease [Pseudoduganella rivuli]MRV76305.1 DNA mismatch endonuclease Vsr [Pseudoduganella rivuli]